MPKIPRNRLEALSDGIFAIVMTLLVLGIEVPTLPANVTPIVVGDYIFNTLLPQIGIYIISFAILGSLWLNHNIFYSIKYTDVKFQILNMLWLMPIAIVPFTAAFVSKYGQYQFAQLIFALNMFIIGVIFYANWNYAVKNELLQEPAKPYAKMIKQGNLILPILSLIAIAVSFIVPEGCMLVFILVIFYNLQSYFKN
ncbi:TMEM175 family protein [Methanobacterium petrolearium]|uniref:TMEM175 family protein n=1 Tax=Methanobacterium petrolearium TaxID=710190 RepID=UPI001AEA78FD|nr:TMEM175 family protein [Methanobacterium petrolearium]MBP1944867.1 putative membrane protein [Methanobacterium petrolearium]